MIFTDLSDSRFSNILSEAANSLVLGPEKNYAAFCAMIETKRIASFVKQGIAFPGQYVADAIFDQSKEEFLASAEGLFRRYWKKSNQKGLDYAHQIIQRYFGLRVLHLAIEHTESSPSKERFCQLYDRHGARLAAVRGTVKSVEDTAAQYWDSGKYLMAVQILAAGIVWHDAAKISFGTEVLRKRLKQYAGEMGKILLDHAQNLDDPAAAEKAAIRAVKVYCMGFGLVPDLVDQAWKIVETNLIKRFYQLKKRVEAAGDAKDYDEVMGQLETAFWFVPEKLDAPLRNLTARFAADGSDYFLKRSLTAVGFSAKIGGLKSGLGILGMHLGPDNSLSTRLQALESAQSKMVALTSDATKKMESGHLPEVVRTARERVQVLSGLEDPFDVLENDMLAKMEEQAGIRIEKCEKQLLLANEQGMTRKAWHTVTRAMVLYPLHTQARMLQSSLEQSLAVSGDVLHLIYNERQIRWFAKSFITLARDHGDIALSLLTLSGSKKPVEFSIDASRAFVTHRDSHYPVMIAEEYMDDDTIFLCNRHFSQVDAHQQKSLGQTGELVCGMLARMTWKKAQAGLLLWFEKPFLPSEVMSDTTYSLEDLWPGFETQIKDSIVLAPEVLSIHVGEPGADAELPAAVSLPGRQPGDFIVTNQGGRFFVESVTGELLVGGQKCQKAPVMENMTYRLQDCEISFAKAT